jgi:hypothetical protein
MKHILILILIIAKEITVNNFDDDVSIDRFEMFNDRHYRKEIATLNIVINGCRFEASLSIGGTLEFPDGVDISYAMRARATELARRQALADLAHKWFGRSRGSGTVHLIRPVDACEDAG